MANLIKLGKEEIVIEIREKGILDCIQIVGKLSGTRHISYFDTYIKSCRVFSPPHRPATLYKVVVNNRHRQQPSRHSHKPHYSKLQEFLHIGTHTQTRTSNKLLSWRKSKNIKYSTMSQENEQSNIQQDKLERGKDTTTVNEANIDDNDDTKKEQAVIVETNNNKDESNVEGNSNDDGNKKVEPTCLHLFFQRCWDFYWENEFVLLVVIVILLAKAYPPLGAQYFYPTITSTWIAVVFIFGT